MAPYLSASVSRPLFFVYYFGIVWFTFSTYSTVSGYSTLMSRLQLFENTFQSMAFLVSTGSPTTITLPLKYLPNAGCLALPIIVQNSFQYYAIIDTGSPFGTAPSETMKLSLPSNYPSTQEQYGESIGSMEWRVVPKLQMGDEFVVGGITVGVPASNVVEDVGGIYLGLMSPDDYRPSLLEQLGYTSFSLDYPKRQLRLSKKSLVTKHKKNTLFSLYNLQPFGENLNHYAIPCKEFTLLWNDENRLVVVDAGSLKRPVIVVLDSGLTGCILSDSLVEELDLADSYHSLTGMHVDIGNACTFQSDERHWGISSFRLPWFHDEQKHPHILVAGGTFLSQSTITVDIPSRTANVII
jgi:hypothetical protein